MKTKLHKLFIQTTASGFLFCASFHFLAFAEPAVSSLPSDLAVRFEKLESRIAELQNQLVEQNKLHGEEIEGLRRQIEIRKPEEGAVYVASGAPSTPKWLEGLAMGGDFRLRYEGIERNEAARERNRFRYRLRWKVTKKLSEDLDFGFRLVNGSTTDPTATNQTMTGDFTYKSFLLDQAYVKYHPSLLSEHLPFLEKSEFSGGKFENPFLAASSGLVWDADVMPEGFAESFEFSFLEERFKPFVNLGQFLLQENETLADAELYGVQTGMRWNPPGLSKDSGVQVTNALGYYDFSDYGRDSNFLVSGTSLARGNTRYGSSSSLAAGDFDILQIYNEIKFKAGKLPVKLFADFATNLADQAPDPDGRNVGYEYGLKLGSIKKKGDWEAGYYYAYVEPNAVVGAFSDSDFGAGHADKRGSAAQFRYMLTDSLKLGLTAYFVNNITGADDETRRFQTDLDWVF